MLISRLFLFCVLIISTFTVSAKDFMVSYDGFYDRLKVVNKGDFQYAQVNFYVTDIASGKPCLIDSGKIVTETRELALSYTDQAQLQLPFDKQLDTDKAVIVLTPQNSTYDCQLKMQIEAQEFNPKPLTRAKLLTMHNEFDELLYDLSGFFVSKLMSFLLPEQQGVVLTFAEPVTINDAAFMCDGAVCNVKVDDRWEDDIASLNISTAVLKVTPWIVK